MKNIFLGSVITMCGVLFLVIIMTLSGKQLRANELRDAVENALISTVENQFDEKSYDVNNTDEFIADFMQALLVQINSDCSIEIRILNVDQAKGLLSVEVIEHFYHPIGTEGQISVQRTVIMEQYSVSGD